MSKQTKPKTAIKITHYFTDGVIKLDSSNYIPYEYTVYRYLGVDKYALTFQKFRPKGVHGFQRNHYYKLIKMEGILG